MYQIVNTRLNLLVFMNVTPLKYESIAIVLNALYNTVKASYYLYLFSSFSKVEAKWSKRRGILPRIERRLTFDTIRSAIVRKLDTEQKCYQSLL